MWIHALWCEGQVLPNSLADLVEDDCDVEDDLLQEESDTDSGDSDMEY